MTKLSLPLLALMCGAALLASSPAYAASRSVEFSKTNFTNRCLAQGGSVRAQTDTILCGTSAIEVRCHFVEMNLADCTWPGIDNQTSVNRIIGIAAAVSAGENDGGGTGGKRPRWSHNVIKF